MRFVDPGEGVEGVVSFEVHPDAGAGPAAVPPGLSPVAEFTEHAAVDPITGRDTMFIRVVQIDEGDGRVAARPSILLAMGRGPATTLAAGATSIPVEPGGAVGAVATLTAEPDDVQLVEVEVLEHLRWRIQLGNNDSVARRYVWVVGSTSSETRQPFLDVVTRTLAFDARVGQTAPAKDVTMANFGTGPLTIADVDGADLGSGFRLLGVAPRPIAGNHRAVARIDFTAPGTPGTATTTHDFGSDDPAAGDVEGHGRRLALSASVLPQPTVTVPDVLEEDVAQARATLESLGLEVATTLQAVPGLLPNFVGFQDPNPGTVVPVGTTVSLVVGV